jgi:hypothetical protein
MKFTRLVNSLNILWTVQVVNCSRYAPFEEESPSLLTEEDVASEVIDTWALQEVIDLYWMQGELSSEGHKPLTNKSCKQNKHKLGVPILVFLRRAMIPGLHFHGFQSMVSQTYQRENWGVCAWTRLVRVTSSVKLRSGYRKQNIENII